MCEIFGLESEVQDSLDGNISATPAKSSKNVGELNLKSEDGDDITNVTAAVWTGEAVSDSDHGDGSDGHAVADLIAVGIISDAEMDRMVGDDHHLEYRTIPHASVEIRSGASCEEEQYRRKEMHSTHSANSHHASRSKTESKSSGSGNTCVQNEDVEVEVEVATAQLVDEDEDDVDAVCGATDMNDGTNTVNGNPNTCEESSLTEAEIIFTGSVSLDSDLTGTTGRRYRVSRDDIGGLTEHPVEFLMSWNRRIAESSVFFDLMVKAGFVCEHKGKCVYSFTVAAVDT